MSLTVPGVPESIPRSKVLALIEALGIDPAHLVSLTFQRAGVHVEVHADGRPGGGFTEAWRFTADGETIATHRLCIPIVDESSGGSLDERKDL